MTNKIFDVDGQCAQLGQVEKKIFLFIIKFISGEKKGAKESRKNSDYTINKQNCSVRNNNNKVL